MKILKIRNFDRSLRPYTCVDAEVIKELPGNRLLVQENNRIIVVYIIDEEDRAEKF